MEIFLPLESGLLLQNGHTQILGNPGIPFIRYADDVVCQCRTRNEAERLLVNLKERLGVCKLELHPVKTKLTYCKDNKRKGTYPLTRFNFLGFSFHARTVQDRQGNLFTGFNPEVSRKSLKRMNESLQELNDKKNTDCAAKHLAGLDGLEHRLKMHGLPHGAGLNIFCLQGQTNRFPVRTKQLRGDEHHREPPIGNPIIGLGHEFNPRHVFKCIFIKSTDLPLAAHATLQHLELPPANASQNIAHAVIEPDLGVLIVGKRLPCLLGQKPGTINQCLVMGGQHAPARGGHDLVAVKGKNRCPGTHPGMDPLVCGNTALVTALFSLVTGKAIGHPWPRQHPPQRAPHRHHRSQKSVDNRHTVHRDPWAPRLWVICPVEPCRKR